MKKNTWRRTETTPNKLQFLLWIRMRVESSCFQFLVHSFFTIWHNLEYIIYAQIVHPKPTHNMYTCYIQYTQSKAEESSTEWNSMGHGSLARSTQLLGTLSAFDHAFNLLKLQLKLEKNSEMISLFFALCAHLSSAQLRPMPIFFSSLYSIYIFFFNSRNVISFTSSPFASSSINFFFISFFYSCMILIQFIAYLKTHKN